jgi:2-furoyl-CoA dehydrogenase FAD binding subunit
MKPPPFDYVRAETIAEVHALLAQEGGEARVLAGGQTLIPMLSMRLARPKVLIDVMAIGALAKVEHADGYLRIGAAVRQGALRARPHLAALQPLLAQALPWVGHAQTRSRGTLCGSVAHADPSAEIPLVVMALDGNIELSSRRRRRRLPAAEFFTGMMSTERRDDELIEAIRLPVRAPGTGYAFREIGRRHGDFAIVACAAVATAQGTRLAVGGVADRPTAWDLGCLQGTALEAALDQLAFELGAADDLHASAAYRRGLVRTVGRAVIEEARHQCGA